MHCKSYSHFSAKNFSIFAYHDVNFKESLTNDVVSFEQLGPGCIIEICVPSQIFNYMVLKKKKKSPNTCNPNFVTELVVEMTNRNDTPQGGKSVKIVLTSLLKMNIQ